VVRECEMSYQELENQLWQEDEGQRKINILIFGLEEIERGKNKFWNSGCGGQVSVQYHENRGSEQWYWLCS
jgi:hypothetical protein